MKVENEREVSAEDREPRGRKAVARTEKVRSIDVDPGNKKPHVVIVGAGFGGLAATRALRRTDVRVTVVDKRNHHLFQPLLYQVATAGLAATDIASPIRRLVADQENAKVLLARATAIDAQRKCLKFVDGELAYDYLILAAGMTNSYFGHPEWEAHAPGLKSLEEALDIRRRILLAFESAEKEPDPKRRVEWLTFVVIGGGATGVELAGALAEIAQRTMARDFRNFDPRSAKVVLLEGGDRLLAALPDDLSAHTLRDLQDLHVDVRLGVRATGIDDRGVQLANERIAARTVLWAAGVQGVPLAKTLGVPVDRQGRVAVMPDLTVPGCPGVFVIGDIAACKDPDGKFLPGVAQVAIQQGKHTARNIRHILNSQPLLAFHYRDLGTMATIGRSRAVAFIGATKMTGLIAWLAWLLVHLMALVDFRNRVAVLMEWAWAYITYGRSARIILERSVDRQQEPDVEPAPDSRALFAPVLPARRAKAPAPPPSA